MSQKQPGKAGTAKKGGGRGRGRGGPRDDEYFGGRANKELLKPPEQEKLTDLQLKEEIIRSLTAIDPLKSKNLVVWNYNESVFVPYSEPEQMVTLLYIPSELLFQEEVADYESETATSFLKADNQHPIKNPPLEFTDEVEDPDADEDDPDAPKRKSRLGSRKTSDESKESKEGDEPPPPPSKSQKEDKGDEVDPEAEGEGDDASKPSADGKPKKLLNQFNFCERACQTYNNPHREKICQTQPPPRSSHRDYCNQWIIYDAYAKDQENRPKNVGKVDVLAEAEEKEAAGEGEEKKEEKKPAKKEKEAGKIVEKEKVKMRKQSVLEGQAAVDLALLRASEGLSMIERMVTQNVFEEVLDDFMYFEDASDEYRDTGEGTLLPLWKFMYDRAKKMHVTCISWSLSQPDLFAVSYGSFSFIHPVLDGMVVIYSLRNPSYPEQAWLAPKGAMSCHIHPTKPVLVAVGLYDGNVAILNLKKNELNEPRTLVLRNIPTEMKHRAPVWSVRWGADDFDGNPNFFSAGMDGRIIHWNVGVQDLQGLGGLSGTDVSTLHLPLPPVTGPDGTTYKLFGCARCLCFHPKEKTTFLVGTAEGNIFRCSSLYGSRFPQIYNAHFLPVATIEWNHYHPEVFISCSEDWTIKIWDRRDPEPMYVFEIGLPILDVSWAPYSSTVFAAVTDEGKVLVYDLNVNKDKPICVQQVVTKKKVHPHRIAFNPHYPIIIVGDDRGHLTTLKLSPNLRILPKDTRNMYLEGDAKITFEINKMAKLLSLVRDPESITNPKVIPGPGGEGGSQNTNAHAQSGPVTLT